MKKYRVSFEITIFMICLFSLSAGTLILSLFLGLYKEDFILIGMIAFMLFVFPLALLVLIIYMMWPTIILDDEGIKKYLFGKFRRQILWEEVKSIKLLGGYNQWLFVSKSELTTKSLTIARMKKDNIYLYIKKDMIEELKKYVPHKMDSLYK